METKEKSGFRRYLPVALILCAVFAAYLLNLNDFFLYDNFTYPSSGFSWKEPIVRSVDEYLRITPGFFTIPVFIFQYTDVAPEVYTYYFHLLKIFFHLCNCLAVFFLVRLLTKNAPAGLLVVLLFGLHPINSEAVAASPSADVVCTFFYLLALIAYVRFREAGRISWYVWSLLFFLLALFSKEMALSLLPVLIALDTLFLRQGGRRIQDACRHAAAYVPYLLLTVFYLILRFTTVARYGGYGFLVEGHPEFYWVFKDLGLLRAGALYLFRMVYYPWQYFLLPLNKQVFGSYVGMLGGLLVLVVIAAIGIGAGYSLRQQRNSRLLLFAAGWMVLACLPVFFLVHVIDYGKAGLINSKYLYLSSVGFSLLLAGSLWSLPRSLFRRVLTGGVFVLYSIVLLGNNWAWSEASKVAYQIPRQTQALYPLKLQEKKAFYFLPAGDELYYYRGVPTYGIDGALDRGFRLLYGFPVRAYVIDPGKVAEDRFFSRVRNETARMTDEFDLRRAVKEDYVLRWNAGRKTVEDMTPKVIDVLQKESRSSPPFSSAGFDVETVYSQPNESMVRVRLSREVPVAFLDAIEIKIAEGALRQQSCRGTLMLSDDFPVFFDVPCEAGGDTCRIPIRLRRIEDLTKKTSGIKVYLVHPRGSMTVCGIRVLAYGEGVQP